MQKMIWSGIGAGAAAVIGIVSLFGAGRIRLSNTAQSPAQLETTSQMETGQMETIPFETQDITPTADHNVNMAHYKEKNYEFVGWIKWYDGLVICETQDFDGCLTNMFDDSSIALVGYQIPGNERYLVLEEESGVERDIDSRFFMLYEQTDKKDPATKLALGTLNAYYGVITDIGENSIFVQGLEDNAVNNRSLIEYSKNDIAAVSGYAGEKACTLVDDLQIGDKICLIESGTVQETYPGRFDGIAKVILISRDSVTDCESEPNKTLTEP